MRAELAVYDDVDWVEEAPYREGAALTDAKIR
jgi:hypothetical protein